MAEKQHKPAGFWSNWKNAKRELKKIIAENDGEFPTQTYLRESGRAYLGIALGRYHGGAAKVQRRLGFRALKAQTEELQDWDWLVKELTPLIEKNGGEFPNTDQLVEEGRRDIIRGINKYHGGIIRVIEKMGYEPGRTSSEKVSDLLWLASQLYGIMAQTKGDFPSKEDLAKLGRSDIANSIQNHHGGLGRVRKIFGLEYTRIPPSVAKDWSWVYSQLEKIVEDNKGVFPKQREMISLGRADLAAIIHRYHGGLVATREKYESCKDHPSQTERLESLLDTYVEGEAA